MYSKPPPTASVAEVRTAHSSFDHRHSRRIGPTSIGVACRKTFCLPADFSRLVLWSLCWLNSALASTAAALDPENGVAIVGFHGEAELHLEFLSAPHEVENFLGLLRQAFQFARQASQRLIERQELIAVFFQKFAAGFEGKASFARRQQREEELRPLAQTAQRSGERSGHHAVVLKRSFHIAGKIFDAQVADRNSEIVSGDIFQFVGFVENHRRCLGQNARIGRTIGLQLDGEIGEEEMMIDDDDVALHAAAAHFGDEAALELAAFLSDAGVGARIELVPERAGLGEFGKFRAVAGGGCLFPGGNRAILLDLLQAAEHGLIGEVVELLAAQIIVAAFHVADGKRGMPEAGSPKSACSRNGMSL